MSKGIDPFDIYKMTFCQLCIEGKQYKEKFPISGIQKATKLFKLFHFDICGLV